MGLMFMQKKIAQNSKIAGNASAIIPAEVKEVLEEFSGVFDEPRSLPPYRRQDHAIPLEEGIKGLSSRPYRYSSTQKDMIEKLVDEMLHT